MSSHSTSRNYKRPPPLECSFDQHAKGISLVPVGTASRLEKPTRKKRRLDFTKCDVCRRDKQKCLPIEREFPAKCFRCIQKGFSCSEGHRAKKGVVSEPVNRNISSELVITTNRPHSELKDENRNWLLIISYHKNMSMAMNCSHRILKETNELFSRVHKDVKDDVDFWTLDSQPGSDFEKFHTVFNALSLVAQATLESMVVSDEPEDLRAALSTFRFQVLWNKIPKADRECIHCLSPVYAKSILKELHQLEDPAAAFFMRLAIIDHCHSYRLFWPDFKDRIRERHADVQSKCETLLRQLDLYNALPYISQQHTLYYPDKFIMCWGGVGEVVANYQLDCLGRNQLHHHVMNLELDDYFVTTMCQATQLQDTFRPHQDSFNEPDIFGRTPLHVACHKMSLHTVKTLLKFGADVKRMTIFGSRPLHYAAARGSNEICRALLAIHEINTNALDKHGCTALAYAIMKEHVDVVKLLLSEKLGYLADPDVYGPGCRPPLMYAILQGNEKIVRYLLDAGADAGAEFNGYNAFHFATNKKNLQMMALLTEKISEHLLDTKNLGGRTPLMTAVCDKFTEGVSLISALTGVDLNARDNEGCTPLILAARTGQYGVVIELLKHFVDASAVDEAGRTAADWARATGYSSTADMIELYEGVESFTEDIDGSRESVEADED